MSFDRVLRGIVLLPLAALGVGGAGATVRSLSAPRLAIVARPPWLADRTVVEVRVETPGRVDIWLDVDLVGSDGVTRLASRLVPKVRWAFWNPAPARETLRLELTRGLVPASGARSIVLRATAAPGPVWLWWKDPLVRELALPVRGAP